MVSLLSFLLLAGLVQATPLQPTFSSCLSSYSPVALSGNRLDVTDVYAAIVSAEESAEQGLQGSGHPALRLDLIGTVGAEVVGYDNTTNKLATLFTNTNAASFNVYQSTTWLCNSLFPSKLPGPYYPYNTTYCPLPAGDFAINLTIPLYRSYALTTLHTQVRIVDTSDAAATLACYNIHVTPYKQKTWYYRLFLWLPVAVAAGFWIVSWAARFYTGWIVGSGVAEYGAKEAGGLKMTGVGGPNKREIRLRKWGTMIISGLSGERLSVSGGLLRFVTPSLKDIMFHIQFSAMLGMIAVNWPQFAYPIFAREAWSHLIWNATLVQGANSASDRIDTYPTNNTTPASFSSQMNDAQYPLYLDADSYNPVLDLHSSSPGMQSFATAVGLRPQDMFGTCLVIFLVIAAAVFLMSVVVWAIHGLTEYFAVAGVKQHGSPSAKRSSLHSSPPGSMSAKNSYDPRNPTNSVDGLNTLPTRASLAQQRQPSLPSRFRRTWLRFRFKGEAGAFHAAALYGNMIRLILIFHLPITIFSIYQLTLGKEASIVSRVFAALSFAFISVIIPAFILWKISRTPSGKLYDATRTLLSLGPMYNIYVEGKHMFRGFPLAASLVMGVVVGAGQKSGIAQAIVIILVELVMLIVPGAWFPWAEGSSMGLPNAFLSMLRLISIVMVMLLSPTIGMTTDVRDWLTYAILILQAIIFIFFLFMLLTKVIEAAIRVSGDVHFDESNHPLDGGIFAAIMDLDCLNGVRGGKAAARKRRKRGSRQLQRNVSAAGSLTTQMMLDRHSQGVPRPPVSTELSTPFLTPGYSAMPMVERQSYFPGYQPPLGPPPVEPERLSSESRSAEGPGDNIMDAWRPTPVAGTNVASGTYGPSTGSPSHGTYAPVRGYSGTGQESTGTPTRNFSVIRGGRANFENPYEVLAAPVPNHSSYDYQDSPPIRVAQIAHRPMSPPHNRTQSSTAVIESGSPPLITPAYSPSASRTGATPRSPAGIRANNQGLKPPALAIPKRRSLNDLKNEPSPDSAYSDSIAKKHKRGKSAGWFKHHTDSARTSDQSEESDDEPGPSRRKGKQRRRPAGADAADYREPLPYEDVTSPVGGGSSRKGASGWKRALGLGRKHSVDEFTKQAQDENKARKAALAAESGALFAGVDGPTSSPGKGFVVHRPGPQPLSPTSPSSYAEPSSTFKVRRTAQPVPRPQMVSTTSPMSAHPSPNPNGGDASGASSASATPGADGAPAEKKGFRVLRPVEPVVTERSTPATAYPSRTGGYPSSAFIPVSSNPNRLSADSALSSGAPGRPARNPRRPSAETARD
ncbi:hypothetical protein IAU60_004216 [Kwoniella sp. DSM 27419]